MRRRAVLTALVFLLALPAPARAWSFDLHRYITSRALALLPAGLRSFFERPQNRAFVVEHSIDPDLWRNAGFAQEPPRHFLDLDAYGAFPFVDLPRDYDEAVRKFGAETVAKNGLLPWRGAEIFERLVKAFRDTQGASPYAPDDVKFFAAVLSHYTGDAHVPFHAALNHDGQLTNQHGIHSRFEGELFRRFESRVVARLKPPPLAPIQDPRDALFQTLLDSFGLVEPVLAADRRAAAGRTEYDDDYFARFFAGAHPVLERRLSEAISGVASMIAGAWEKAGRPDLSRERPRTNRKIRGGP